MPKKRRHSINMHDENILKTKFKTDRSQRAQEYDELISQAGHLTQEHNETPFDKEFSQLMEVIEGIAPVDPILELASGTGIWTNLLVHIGEYVTAVDASPEMHTINREKVHSDRVNYVVADLFDWTPEAQYDLVFFAFFLSHVPQERLSSFLEKVKQAVRPGGTVFVVDQSGATAEELAVTHGQYQERTLSDGRQYTIVKVYYPPEHVQEHLEHAGFENMSFQKGDLFFYLSGTRVR